MIGNAKWFCPRKFGWGLGIRTKEGIFYMAAVAALAALVSVLPISAEFKWIGVAVIVLVVLVDVLHIMTQVYSKLDEREQAHEAMAERNSSFVAVVCLVGYIGYLSLSGADYASYAEKLYLPVAILLAMSVAKGATLLYLERKG